MKDVLLIPMMTHMAWCAALYAALTVLRAPKVWGLNLSTLNTIYWREVESRTSANLSNQFEWPLFFHVVCLIVFANPQLISNFVCGLAWIFVAARVLHSIVHIFILNIRLRGAVFAINFLVVVVMWITLLIYTYGN